MGMTEFMEQMQKAQENLDKCKVCGRTLPPGTGVNKIYDDKLGSFTVCIDCSLKAVMLYVRKLYSTE